MVTKFGIAKDLLRLPIRRYKYKSGTIILTIILISITVSEIPSVCIQPQTIGKLRGCYNFKIQWKSECISIIAVQLLAHKYSHANNMNRGKVSILCSLLRNTGIEAVVQVVRVWNCTRCQWVRRAITWPRASPKGHLLPPADALPGLQCVSLFRQNTFWKLTAVCCRPECLL